MNQSLTQLQLNHFIQIFKDLTGIQYSKEKLYLFENRLGRFVGPYKDYNSYDELLHDLQQPENITLKERYINELTTNYTYFFRESTHFRFLQHIIQDKFSDIKEIRLWSAAASGGHEAYSMAITIDSLMRATQHTYKILGTDIAKDKIESAKNGLYNHEDIEGHIHQSTIDNYFNFVDGSYQVVDKIKKNVQFAHLNIMGDFPFKDKFHIIFLRNILIYFKKEEKEQILINIANYLQPNGYLIVSLSESLTGLNVPLKHISHSIYIHSNQRHVLK